MFKPMAQTVSFALIGALLLSLTYVPAVSAALLLSKKLKAPRKDLRRPHHYLFSKPVFARAGILPCNGANWCWASLTSPFSFSIWLFTRAWAASSSPPSTKATS
jgi:cobalt-zinc-cadmium resistance protein CzcA